MKNQKKRNTFYTIALESGISVGQAAKELTEGGLKIRFLERVGDVAYTKSSKDPWEFKHRSHLTKKQITSITTLDKKTIFEKVIYQNSGPVCI